MYASPLPPVLLPHLASENVGRLMSGGALPDMHACGGYVQSPVPSPSPKVSPVPSPPPKASPSPVRGGGVEERMGIIPLA